MSKKNTFLLKSALILSTLGLTACAHFNQNSSPSTNSSTTSSSTQTSAPHSNSQAPGSPKTPVMLEPIQLPGPMKNGQFDSLWDVMRTGFTMNHHYNNASVQTFVHSYTHNPSFIPNVITQATPYLYTIVSSIQERDLPMELALLPIVESGFKPHAISYCGAAGLWQLMPATARDLNTGKESYWYTSRQSVQESTTAALNYLKYLYNYFDGQWLLALAAYNAGPGTVQNAMNRNRARGLPTDFWSLHLPTATRNYVPQLLALAIIINNPSDYGIVLPPVPNKPLIGSTVLTKQMSLSQAAKFAEIEEAELRILNPGFKRNVTPPLSTGTYSLNLPINHVNTFEQNCAANPGVTGLERYANATAKLKKSGRYTVRKGDTLITASHMTGIPVATLRSYNHLKSNTVHKGQVLRYPIDQTSAYHFLTYRVKKGDTIDSIARRYHVNSFDLMQRNNLRLGSKLRPGQRLVIRQKTRY